MSRLQKGFTLIELLVVISIISLMSSVVFTSLARVRVQARVAQSVSDLREIRSALEAYYQDKGVYPSTGGGWDGYISDYGADLGLDWIPDLTPEYFRVMAREPRKTSDGTSQYLYRSLDGRDYKLIYLNPEDCQSVKTKYLNLVDPVRNDVIVCWAYGFWSPGGASY